MLDSQGAARGRGVDDERPHMNAAEKKPSAKLGRDIQTKLGQQLRAMYDDVVSQGVPDRFSEILNRLENSGEKDKR